MSINFLMTTTMMMTRKILHSGTATPLNSTRYPWAGAFFLKMNVYIYLCVNRFFFCCCPFSIIPSPRKNKYTLNQKLLFLWLRLLFVFLFVYLFCFIVIVVVIVIFFLFSFI